MNETSEGLTEDVTEVAEATEDASLAPAEDLRADVEAAFSEHEQAEPSEAESDESEQPAEATRNAAGNQEAQDDAKKVAESTDGSATSSEAPRAKQKQKPPLGWKAEAREAWDALPETVRDQVSTREKEIAVAMQDTAEARRFAQTFSDTLTPFKQPLESMGYQDPFSAIRDIVGTAIKMRNGSASERAQATAKVIQDFGVDINALDEVLAGDPSTTTSSTADLEALLDKRLAPVNDFLSQQTQRQQRQQQQHQQQTATEVTDFMSDQEFANDVRLDMADLLDLAAARGQSMTLQDAYDKACLINPQVSNVVRERQRAADAKKIAAVNGRKRVAASSITGNPAGNGAQKSPETLRGALSDAWDLHIR
ncbi:MAG: hypothetical protein ACR2P4_00015 [Gammaproteobacteria bacterium]